MKALRLLTLLAVCCATSTTWAAEPVPAKPATPAAKPAASESAAPKADEPTQAPSSSAAGSSKADEGTQDQDPAKEPQAVAKPKSSGKGSPERFVPSEQVRADFDVSFPIDI